MTGDREDVLGKAYDGRLMRRLAAYVRPYGGLVALTLVTLFAAGAVQLVQPYLVKEVIDKFIVARRTQGLALPALLFLASLAADFVLGFLQVYLLERTGQNVVFDLRNAVFAHLQRLPSSFFDRTPVGRLMTRVTTDVESINEAFTSGVVLILADLAKLLGIVVILIAMDVRLALVTFAVVPPMLLISWWFRVRVRDAYRVSAAPSRSSTRPCRKASAGCASCSCSAASGSRRRSSGCSMRNIAVPSSAGVLRIRVLGRGRIDGIRDARGHRMGRRWPAARRCDHVRHARRFLRVRGPFLPPGPGTVAALHRHAGRHGLRGTDLRAAGHRGHPVLAGASAPRGRGARAARSSSITSPSDTATARPCSTTCRSVSRPGRPLRSSAGPAPESPR
jgi:hypothetical protein